MTDKYDITFRKDFFIDVFAKRIHNSATEVRLALTDETAFRIYCAAVRLSAIAENLADLNPDEEFIKAMYAATLELEKAMTKRLQWESRSSPAEHWARRS